MTDIKSASVAFGSLTYNAEVPEEPTRTERDGDTTVYHVGTDRKPGYFEASYMVTCKLEGVEEYSHFFHLNVQVPSENAASVPYAQVEAEGARQLAPLLRAIADQIEKQVAAFDERMRNKPSEPLGHS